MNGASSASVASPKPSRPGTSRVTSWDTRTSTPTETGTPSPATGRLGADGRLSPAGHPIAIGRWTWISPWGWTWVDRAQWGFAPFHYGRWAHLATRWCWVPGPRFHRPVWAPGLVAWQRGPGLGNPNTRPVSWIPLGPRDVYVPSKNVSPRYLRNVNIANTAITNNALPHERRKDRVRDIRYANRDVPGAVTTVPRTAFTLRVRARSRCGPAISRTMRGCSADRTVHSHNRGLITTKARGAIRALSRVRRPIPHRPLHWPPQIPTRALATVE